MPNNAAPSFMDAVFNFGAGVAEFARGGAQTFDQMASGAPNAAAQFAGWAALIVVLSITSGKHVGLNLIKGARDSRVDRTIGFAINLALALGAATLTHNAIQGHYGIARPDGDKYYRQIKADPRGQAAYDELPARKEEAYKAPKRTAVNPNGSTCTFKIDPLARKNCPQ